MYTGSAAAVGHTIENSIPLSIFPITQDKFCFCFCGLPGRGKTHIASRLAKYLSFFHAVPVQVFNVAEYRERMFGGLKDADWFDPGNASSSVLIDECNKSAIEDMARFLLSNSNGCAIMDAPNATHARREYVRQEVLPYPPIRLSLY